MSKVQQNKEKKKQAILEAAQRVFISEGFVQASMDEIAKRSSVTKQTVYRYFPSKAELFEATLRKMGEVTHGGFSPYLELANTEEALTGFAKEFIEAHLCDEHLATLKLLINESSQAPELTSRFYSVGPDNTHNQLSRFFEERFNSDNPESLVRLWTAMLLSQRTGVLLGKEKPNNQQIEQHAKDATQFLLAAIALR